VECSGVHFDRSRFDPENSSEKVSFQPGTVVGGGFTVVVVGLVVVVVGLAVVAGGLAVVGVGGGVPPGAQAQAATNTVTTPAIAADVNLVRKRIKNSSG
jgi:hypothetical protein